MTAAVAGVRHPKSGLHSASPPVVREAHRPLLKAPCAIIKLSGCFPGKGGGAKEQGLLGGFQRASGFITACPLPFPFSSWRAHPLPIRGKLY